MTFLNPGGLWLLAGIPILILLYLLRSKYTEQMLSSTYLWRLSERYKKPSILPRGLMSIWLLLVQLVTVVLFSLLLSQPSLVIGEGSKHCIAILDISASMQVLCDDGETRFAHAQTQILSMARELPIGAEMTVITTESTNNLLVDQSQSYLEIEGVIRNAVCGWGEGDIDYMLSTAERLFRLGQNSEVFFYTDKAYSQVENVTVINVASKDAWNVAIANMKDIVSDAGIVFEHSVTSFNADAALTMALYIDGELQAAKIVDASANEDVTVTWRVNGLFEYTDAKVIVDAEDALAADNEYRLFGQSSDSIRVLLMSKEPLFFSTAFQAFPAVSLDLAENSSDVLLSGYDLYLFDHDIPQTLPTDGTSWLINPQADVPELNLVLGDPIRGTYLTKDMNVSDGRYQALADDLDAGSIAIKQFREALSYEGMTSVLLCGQMPVLLASQTAMGARQLVMLFDLHQANLPLQANWVFLVRNVLQFAMPAALKQSAYGVGDEIEITVLPFCQNLYVQQLPNDLIPIAFEGDSTQITALEPGTYSLLQTRANASSGHSNFFVHIPYAQSDTSETMSDRPLSLSKPENNGADEEQNDQSSLDLRFYIAALLLAFLVIEGVVYHRGRV